MGYEDFSRKCDELRKLSEDYRSENLPEQQTRNAFIDPFFRELGYDVGDLTVVRAQYPAGFEGANQQWVDYAFMDGKGKPTILVEAKSLNTAPTANNVKQLHDYCTYTHTNVGILTTGAIYRVYLDKVRPNVLDNEPFFTFDLTIDDESARRVIFKLARLEEGSFDRVGFEEAVEDWRMATNVKPKAMWVFQGWYEGSANDLGDLLARQLKLQDAKAKSRLISSLAAEWFIEFVNGKAPDKDDEENEKPDPPHPDEEWKPLPEWQINTARDMPDEIRFPDLTTARIHKGYDVPIEITRWLRKTGYLKDEHIPIRTGKGGRGNSYLVSFTKESSMLTPKDVEAEGAEPVWVATGFSAEYQVINAQNIIEKATQELMNFSGRWLP